MVPVSHIKEGLVTAPGFPIRVRWVHAFLIGLISKPCACHDALIPSLLPSKKKKKKKTLSLSMSPSRKCSFSKGKWAPLSWKTDFLSYDCPAVGELAFLLHKRAISWRRRKKRGGGIKLLAVPCFSYYYLQPLLPKLTGKKQLYFGRMSISLQGGRGTFSCVCFIWWDSPEETNLLTTVKVL